MTSEGQGRGSITLSNGVQIPLIGLGTFKAQGSNLKAAVKCALDVGIRHIDTAAVYKNERDIAEAIREAAFAREDLFLTTKLGPHQQGDGKATLACEEALQSLRVECVDLLLIHWPGTAKTGLASERNAIKRKETWSVMEIFYKSGRCKAIGVSNFEERHLVELMESANVVPMVNQIEVHPRFQQTALRAFCKQHSIAVVAYASLGCGDLLDDETVCSIAEDIGKTPAQVLLRWGLQQDCAVIPKSVQEEHIKQYSEDALLSWELTDEQMESLHALQDGHKYCWDPAPVR